MSRSFGFGLVVVYDPKIAQIFVQSLSGLRSWARSLSLPSSFSGTNAM